MKGEILIMQTNAFRLFFKIWAVAFATTLYFTQVVIAQSPEQRLIPLVITEENVKQELPSHEFVIYGRAETGEVAGIAPEVDYRPIFHARETEFDENRKRNLKRMPDLESFFEFGGTLELLTTQNSDLEKFDIVISELMWGIDTGLKDTTVSITVEKLDENGDPVLDQNNMPETEEIPLPQFLTQGTQWLELYNTTSKNITTELYLLFTPFISYPRRDVADFQENEHSPKDKYKVLDAVSTLFFGRWELPGKSGRRPNTAFISAYRDIDYDVVEDLNRTRTQQLAGIPFGSYEDSWQETPEAGQRNTELKIVDDNRKQIVVLPYIATPGTKHVPEVFIKPLKSSDVNPNSVVINEVRNDTSRANIDWIELKNVSSRVVDLKDWELSIVTGVKEDRDLVDLPAYQIQKGEILLIVNQHPHFTDLAEGINIEDPEEYIVPRGLKHKYFVYEDLNLPPDKKFMLLLRRANDQNGKDAAIADYAGNGFFTDDLTTEFWPRLAQPLPTNVADFGERTFASQTQAWARLRHHRNSGHEKDAWEVVKAQGGIGYAADANLRYAPGTPGYENDALKTQLKNKVSPAPDTEYDDGEISISEIMYDPGPNGNDVQWIELYNSSLTQAINLKGWEFEIRNLEGEEGTYVDGTFEFEDAVILPNQALLLVAERSATDLPSNRIYDLYRLHRRELSLARWPHLLLSPTAFYLKLTDKANANLRTDDIVVDEVGNLKVEQTERMKEWDLPKVGIDQRRRSLVRLYGGLFKPEKEGLDGKRSPPDEGMTAEGWRRFTRNGQSLSFYGMRNDLASPGYRRGGPVPVMLSSFRPVRVRTGEVVIKWRTESELENAGFNILRNETRDGNFRVINVRGIIPGHGTSSEQHLYSYTDMTAKPNTTYYYRIEDVSFDGVHQTLATVRLKGDLSAAEKLITNWGALKSEK